MFCKDLALTTILACPWISGYSKLLSTNHVAESDVVARYLPCKLGTLRATRNTGQPAPGISLPISRIGVTQMGVTRFSYQVWRGEEVPPRCWMAGGLADRRRHSIRARHNITANYCGLPSPTVLPFPGSSIRFNFAPVSFSHIHSGDCKKENRATIPSKV